ncbi:magnesium transporter [Maricurvus nonylphenolicus]|uniref:NAD/FAD-utilizing enzyme n=1 Tax=Maricurvus nonylphenolicus TaxID=1008307 RepID=UPI0036F226AA
MKRHYYISDSIDDLETVEHELEYEGITTPQIHVLSENDMEVERHHLHEVEAVLKKDVVRGTEIGAIIGAVIAVLILAAAYFSGVTETTTWVPFIFLAVVALGFCTWEGGLFGIQVPHADFKRFQEVLKKGKHVLFVDVDSRQEPVLDRVISHHPKLEIAGVGDATPSWVVGAQNKFKSFVKTMP